MMQPSPFATPTDAAQFDHELITALQGCARRSLPALQKVFDLTAPRVLSELVQLLADRQQAEAVLTETHVLIWQQSVFYSPDRCRPLTWVLALARNLAIDRLHADAHVQPDEVDAQLRFTDAAFNESERSSDLHMLRLSRSSGRMPAEIARALGLPLRQVRQAIHRGLAQLGAESP